MIESWIELLNPDIQYRDNSTLTAVIEPVYICWIETTSESQLIDSLKFWIIIIIFFLL